MLTLLKSNPRSAFECARAMLNGGVVLIPTDTVYGLSAIARNPFTQSDSGAQAIRSIKGRAETKPFITLIADPSDISRFTRDIIPQNLLALWPGALTIVVDAITPRVDTAAASSIDTAAAVPIDIPTAAPIDTAASRADTAAVPLPNTVDTATVNTANRSNTNCALSPKGSSLPPPLPALAFRCPGDKWLREVIKLCKSPIYSTSANISGTPPLHTIEEIRGAFASSAVSLIIDDGDKNALPSTIVRLSGGGIDILRQGSVTVNL